MKRQPDMILAVFVLFCAGVLLTTLANHEQSKQLLTSADLAALINSAPVQQ